MPYGKSRKSGSRSGYSRRAPARRRRVSTRRVARNSSRSRAPSTIRIVVVGENQNAVARPQIGLTAAPIGRRMF